MKQLKLSLKVAVIFAGAAVLLLTGFCGKSYYSRTDLKAEYKDFISSVRYIISNEEKKLFYSLASDTERDIYIEKFWSKRDPDPGTRENEFKDDYYKRIELANHLFRGERKGEGWLTDRGRVFVILGEPDYRRFNQGQINSSPTSRAWYEYPHEIWMYGLYPIYFIDRNENGTFELVAQSARVFSQMVYASNRLNKPFKKIKKTPFGFHAFVYKNKDKSRIIRVRLPYNNILFIQEKENFIAKLDFSLSIFNAKDEIVQDFTYPHTISISDAKLQKLDTQDEYTIDIPFKEKLSPGKYELRVVLQSKIDQIQKRLNIKFEI